MQNTRLSTLFDSIARRSEQWLMNPWRRWSLMIISFLSGFFLGSAVSTTAGQKAELDIGIAAVLVLIVEFVNLLFYRRRIAVGSVWVESLHILKIGLVYSLFLEAFKLGS
jgi:Protein of unknown function (DUF565)